MDKGCSFKLGFIRQVCPELIVFQLASVFVDDILYRDSGELNWLYALSVVERKEYWREVNHTRTVQRLKQLCVGVLDGLELGFMAAQIGFRGKQNSLCSMMSCRLRTDEVPGYEERMQL